jgi:hypothetical protein
VKSAVVHRVYGGRTTRSVMRGGGKECNFGGLRASNCDC